ncbi:CHAT domain-containing protein [Amycolatopsis suaedae]|uniref:CHAT domain-containing protein n=1 Tax=Amycolatopsis suaedae TaxID=2510978 RepID=A0A4Q7JDS2_9PSEU|nr:CHAT domain-containing protein [Amycolatopsis suaedae]RZQ65222.1 CHAT domain-containing protein [Amycolatopsis suaedae]
MPDPFSRAVDAAAGLDQRARAAAANHGPAEAARLFQRALKRLDSVDQVDDRSLELRSRILISLASAETETTSLAAGLGRLHEAESSVSRISVAETRRTLEPIVNLQRAIMLFRTGGRFDEALRLFDSNLPRLSNKAHGVAVPLNLMNRAYVHLQMSNPEAALFDLKRSLELTIEHGHARLEAKVRHNLGDRAQLVGDVPGALHHYEEAARIFESAGPGSLPLVRIDQAKALLTAGLGEEAAKLLDEALPELRRNGVVQERAEAEVARSGAAILEEDFALARRLADNARRRFLRRGNTRWAEIAALTRMRADALDETRPRRGSHLPAGLRHLGDRLSDLGLRDEAAVARLLAVRLYLRRGAHQAAAELLAEVPRPRRTTPIDHRMLLHLCRAELAVATGRTRAALAQARAGLSELGWARDKMGGLDLVCGTAVHGRALGSLAVRLVLDGARGQAGARRVLAWQERTRAQVYRYEPLPAIEDPVLARHIAEMRHVQRTAQQRRLEGKPVGGLESRYAWLQREASRLGWYTSPWGRPRPVSGPDEVAAELNGRALVSLAAHGDKLAAVVVTDGRFTLHRLGALAEVMETAKQLHADLDALAPDHLPAPLADAVSASARTRAQRLDRLLIAPLAAEIGDRELVIVPLGSLYALPWAALPSLRGRPISVAPSGTAWVSASGRPGAVGSGPVVLVGGPGVPGSLGEVSHLRSVYPGAELVDGPKATSAAVLSAVDGAGLAHLVAHGAHEPANALFSRLELVDGPLFAHETTRLGHPPERVVLAACSLAMSHIRPGEEALGFAGTLLARGSRSVIGAIARVGDQAAAEAMTDLHRRLAAGTAPAVALAEATAADPLRRPFLCLGAG